MLNINICHTFHSRFFLKRILSEEKIWNQFVCSVYDMSITLSMYCAHNASINTIAALRIDMMYIGDGVADIHVYKVSISSRWGFKWGRRVIGQHIAIRISSILSVHWLSHFQISPPSQRIHIWTMDVCVRVAFCIWRTVKVQKDNKLRKIM